MKKTLSLLVVAFATCLMMFAEDPGLYLKKGDALTPVKVTRLSNTKKGGSAGAFSIGKEEHKIKGVTSGLTYAKDDSLIFVFPPKSGVYISFLVILFSRRPCRPVPSPGIRP